MFSQVLFKIIIKMIIVYLVVPWWIKIFKINNKDQFKIIFIITKINNKINNKISNKIKIIKFKLIKEQQEIKY
jgi:hypothetical protein